MAETPPINITIDQDALREQVRAVITDELHEMAVKLHHAADALDPRIIEDAFDSAYQQGLRDGRAEHSEPGGADHG